MFASRSRRMLEKAPEDKELNIREFAEGLWEAFSKWREEQGMDAPELDKSGMEIALSHGWLEPQDALRGEEAVCRGDAARILHEFLLRELGEADEEDWGAAKEIKDLYDCRACVRHVAQIVRKGIMTAEGALFERKKRVTAGEARRMFCRLWNPAKRCEASVKITHDSRNDVPRQVSKEEALQMLKERSGVRFWDVRTPGEFASGSMEGAENLPLLQLMAQPERAAADPESPILLGCDGGYRSEIAARRLKEAGYADVTYFGWKS